MAGGDAKEVTGATADGVSGHVAILVADGVKLHVFDDKADDDADEIVEGLANAAEISAAAELD